MRTTSASFDFCLGGREANDKQTMEEETITAIAVIWSQAQA